MSDLDRAVQTVIRRCLNIQPDEDVVVVVDEPLQDLGEKLRTAAQQSGADAVLTVMSPRATDGSEPPAPVAEALAACDVFVTIGSSGVVYPAAGFAAAARHARRVYVGPEEPDNARAFDEHRVGRATEIVPSLFSVRG